MYEQWKDLYNSGQFHPEQNYTESIEIIELLKTNNFIIESVKESSKTIGAGMVSSITIKKSYNIERPK